MRENGKLFGGKCSEKGATLYIVAASMFVLLGISALAIDMASFYVARAEAQRAADAGALAGASVFISQGCTTGSGGCVAGGSQEVPATTQAIAIASQNLIAGQYPSSSTVAASFNYPNKEEPQIKVTVYRDATHGNALPTFFAKIFGINTVNVSAFAWAEAYNPSGGNVAVGLSCLRPFLLPNCDPVHTVLSGNAEENPNCPLSAGNGITCPGSATSCYASYFFDPNNNGAIVNPGVYSVSNPAGGGVVGEPWQLHSNAAPSQWYLLGYTGNSGAALRTFIEMCAPATIACNSSLNTANGKKVGPVDQGIDALINASGTGTGNGQDTICSPTATPACTTPPFPITGGSGNPNPNLVGKTFYSGSTSIINVAVYNGTPLSPGGSTVTVLGFMQLFVIDDEGPPNDVIDTIVMDIGGCGTSSPNPPPVVSEGGSFIPVRLIHQ